MKERPILFSAPMVRAILEGRKTMTRRVVKLPIRTGGDVFGEHWGFDGDDCAYEDIGFLMTYIDDPKFPHTSPYGKVGDRLWVRETFYPQIEGGTLYRSTDEQLFNLSKLNSVKPHVYCWKPSIHMPRWASRITLEVTDIRMQRLQEIDEKDGIAEGVQGLEKLLAGGTDTRDPDSGWESAMISNPVFAFRCLWEKINGERAECDWDSNPWVWVVEFRRVEK